MRIYILSISVHFLSHTGQGMVFKKKTKSGLIIEMFWSFSHSQFSYAQNSRVAKSCHPVCQNTIAYLLLISFCCSLSWSRACQKVGLMQILMSTWHGTTCILFNLLPSSLCAVAVIWSTSDKSSIHIFHQMMDFTSIMKVVYVISIVDNRWHVAKACFDFVSWPFSA